MNYELVDYKLMLRGEINALLDKAKKHADKCNMKYKPYVMHHVVEAAIVDIYAELYRPKGLRYKIRRFLRYTIGRKFGGNP